MLISEFEYGSKKEIETRLKLLQLELEIIFNGHNPNNLNPISLANEIYFIIKYKL